MIPDQVVVEGETLVITNLADPNLADLIFALETNVPAPATLNPTNRVFTWTPTEAQGPSTNLITILAYGESLPGSNGAVSFQVIVLESNSPPTLTFIADRFIHAGSTLAFGASATDTDLPANLLTFSLDPGAPGGATINPTNGLLTWPTTSADANTTNAITVRVTDNGTPAMSEGQTFVVVVLPPPLISGLIVTNDVATIIWNAIPGQTYRVQSRDALDQSTWNALVPDVTAAGPTANLTEALNGAPQRFYRVQVVPPSSLLGGHGARPRRGRLESRLTPQ